MNRIVSTVIGILSSLIAISQTCNYTLEFHDSWGDGWNNASLTFNINGSTTDYTLYGGSDSTGFISVNTGDNITITFNSGAYDSEITYELYDGTGALIVNSNTTPGVVFTGTGNCPNCPAPYNVVLNTVLSTSAQIGWTTGGATDWQIGVVPTGQSVGTAIATTNNPYTATGLTANTTYDIYVRDSCGAGDVSPWAGPITFTTACSAIVAPITESFDLTSTPSCWTESGSEPWNYSTAPGYGAASAGDHTGNGGNFAWIDGSTPNGPTNVSSLYSPLIDVSGLTTPYLSFWVFTNNTDDASLNTLEIEFFDGSGWNSLQVYQGNTVNWTEFTFDLSSYTITGDVQVKFTVTEDGSPTPYYHDILIDDFSVDEAPSCIAPTALTVTNIQSTSADIMWNSGGAADYQVAVVPAGQSVGTANATSSTTFNASGLSANTTYDVYVRDSCGTGNVSNWVGPISFNTLCTAVTAPFMESFDGSTTPNCWTESGSEPWIYNVGAAYGAAAAGDHTGNGGNYAWIDGSTPNGPTQISTLTSPPIDVSGLSSPFASAWVFSNNVDDASLNTLVIEFYDGASWNVLETIQTNTGGWVQYGYDLSGYTISGNVQLQFTVIEDGSPTPYYNDILIDDIGMDEAPSCFNPSNLAVSNVTSNSVDVSWISGGATGWQISVVPTGQGPGSATGVTINPYTFTGLADRTTYDVYVRDSCGIGDVSSWIGPVTFTTPCVTQIPDYLQDFTTFVPNCWNEAAGGNVATGPTTVGASGWVDDGFANNGTTGAAKINLYTTGKEEWLISPYFDLSGSDYQLDFELAMMDYATTVTSAIGSDDSLKLLVTMDNGSSWQTVQSWNNNYVPQAGGELIQIDLTPYSGASIQFAFWATEGLVDDNEDVDVSIDNFYIYDIATCPAPSALTVTNVMPYSADFSWTTGGASNWNILLVDSATSISTTYAASSNTNFNIAGLNDVTTYYAYVQDTCGPGDLSGWVGPIQFTTPESCPAPVNLTVTNVTDSTAIITWTGGGNGTSYNVAVVEAGTPLTGDTSVTSTSYTAVGLESGTLYDVYVQDDCGNGDVSDWVGPVSFGTPCDTYTAPYAEYFNVFIPYCWTQADGGSSATGPTTMGTSLWSGDGFANFGSTGAARVNVSGSGNTTWLISPDITLLGANQFQLDFDLALMQSESSVASSALGSDDLVKLLMTLNNGISWIELYTWNRNSNVLVGGEHFTLDLSPYHNNTAKFAFWASNGSVVDPQSIDVSVDNFVIDEYQTCPAPQNIIVSNITTSGAQVSWTTGGASSWNLEFIEAGSNPTGVGIAVSNNPTTLSSLLPNTYYDVYLQDNCGGGDLSDWTGPVSFGTDCGGSILGDNSSSPIPVSTNTYSNMKNTANCYTSTYSANSSADVWYRLHINSCTESVDLSLCNSGFDTKLFVLDMNQNLLTSDDNSCGGSKSVISNFPVSAGDTLLIVVEGNGSAEGIYQLDITQNQFPNPNAGSNAVTNVCREDFNIDLFPLLGGNPDNTGFWTDLSNTNAMTNGVLDATLVQPGTYYYRYSVNSQNCGVVASAVLAVTVDYCTGIENTFDQPNFTVYPNPGSDNITIEYSNGINNTILKLVSIDGKEVLTKKIVANKFELDISSLDAGVYFIEINNDVERLIKQ